MVGVDLGAVEFFQGQASQAGDCGGAVEGGGVAADVVDDVLHGFLSEVAGYAGLEGLTFAGGLLEGDWASAAVGHDLHAACETCVSISVLRLTCVGAGTNLQTTVLQR